MCLSQKYCQIAKVKIANPAQIPKLGLSETFRDFPQTSRDFSRLSRDDHSRSNEADDIFRLLSPGLVSLCIISSLILRLERVQKLLNVGTFLMTLNA